MPVLGKYRHTTELARTTPTQMANGAAAARRRVRYWKAPRGTWLHTRIGLITVCGKRIVPETWVVVRETPPPDQDQVCPACQRRPNMLYVAPYLNDPRGWMAPETLHLAQAFVDRETVA